MQANAQHAASPDADVDLLYRNSDATIVLIAGFPLTLFNSKTSVGMAQDLLLFYRDHRTKFEKDETLYQTRLAVCLQFRSRRVYHARIHQRQGPSLGTDAKTDSSSQE